MEELLKNGKLNKINQELFLGNYTLTVSSIIEFGENNRFRFPVDSAFLILTAGNIMMWGTLLRSRLKR